MTQLTLAAGRVMAAGKVPLVKDTRWELWICLGYFAGEVLLRELIPEPD